MSRKAERVALVVAVLWAVVATCMYSDHSEGLDACFARTASVEDELIECRADVMQSEYDCDIRVANACYH